MRAGIVGHGAVLSMQSIEISFSLYQHSNSLALEVQYGSKWKIEQSALIPVFYQLSTGRSPQLIVVPSTWLKPCADY